MKTICVLGNGQLGHMLRHAGEQIGITVFLIGQYDKIDCIPLQHSVITAEMEYFPHTSLIHILTRHNNFINRDVFPLFIDRLKQKKLLKRLNLATTLWMSLFNFVQWTEIFFSFNNRAAIVKRRTGGYDGRGQWHIRPGEENTLPKNCYGTCIVEKKTTFDEEISLIGARSCCGTQVFYPFTYNFYQDGILRVSLAFPYQKNKSLQKKAENMLSSILDELNYVGVIAMECFLVGGQLLINELAPRVHNTGHWTQNSASINQFELHLRAILSLPIPTPIINMPGVMINIIGTEFNIQWLTDPLVHLYWYKKEVRSGRKVGHINISHADHAKIIHSLQQLQRLLPMEYQNGMNWAQQKLAF